MPTDPHQAISALVRAEATRTTKPATSAPTTPPTALTDPAPAPAPPPRPARALLRWFRRRSASE
jgi:hypothetical protein